jgi:hypothetical protein
MDQIVKISGNAELMEYFSRLNDELAAISKVKVHGAMRSILRKGNGDILVYAKDNIIVSGGFDFISDAIGNAAARPACMGYIAVGTGTTTPAIAQTALVTEIARIAATYSHTAGTQVFSFASTFAAGTGTGAITESGVLNAASAGAMLDRVSFSVINKGSLDSLTQTFTFSLT